MPHITVPMYEQEDGSHIHEDPGVPYEVVELNPPHNAILSIHEDDAPINIEDLILSVNTFAELKAKVNTRRERMRSR